MNREGRENSEMRERDSPQEVVPWADLSEGWDEKQIPHYVRNDKILASCSRCGAWPVALATVD